MLILLAQDNTGRDANTRIDARNGLQNFASLTSDSLVHVVIEIPAGTSQKWEANKVTGQIEWEQVNPDSFRVINYLPYPANYGFVPRTLLPLASGGDGDPVDVFVLGEHIELGSVVPCKIIGLIQMKDNGEDDSKLIALPVQTHWKIISTFQELNHYYPGVMDILQIWLTHYKGANRVQILSVSHERDAIRFLQTAHLNFIESINKK